METKKAPGPNDHHFVFEGSQLVQKPGLGSDEPSAKEAADAANAAAEVRRREEALERAAADVRNEALALEARQIAAEKKEQERADEHRKAMNELDELRAQLQLDRDALAAATTEGQDKSLQALADAGNAKKNDSKK